MQTKSFYFISALLITAAVSGCSGNNGAKIADSSSPDTAKPAQKVAGAPNTDYKPAFEGQTRIAKVKTATSYKVEKIAENLGIPWAIIPLPDGRLLMTEKTGYMNIN